MPLNLTSVKHEGAGVFSAGHRPFFLLAAAWSAIAMPAWLAAYIHGYAPRALPAMTWHAHEMIYGYALAAVAGFALTAIPNWTGRFPARGNGLAALAALWLAARVLLLFSATLGALAGVCLGAALVLAVGREIFAGRHWRGAPMLVALLFLLAGETLVQLEVLGLAATAALGERLGIATLAALIALVGGRIVPSFTRNWLARARPGSSAPARQRPLDLACLAVLFAGLAAWVAAPYSSTSSALLVAGGAALALRLARWRGLATLREPILFVLHLGYAWLAFGVGFLGLNGLFLWLPPSAGLHAITVGAVGTMTLAVMTRTTLRYNGRPLHAGAGTLAMYGLVNLAAVLRVAAPLAGEYAGLVTSLAGAAWTVAFATFASLYGPLLAKRGQDPFSATVSRSKAGMEKGS